MKYLFFTLLTVLTSGAWAQSQPISGIEASALLNKALAAPVRDGFSSQGYCQVMTATSFGTTEVRIIGENSRRGQGISVIESSAVTDSLKVLSSDGVLELQIWSTEQNSWQKIKLSQKTGGLKVEIQTAAGSSECTAR